jgi:hypothetical protein
MADTRHSFDETLTCVHCHATNPETETCPAQTARIKRNARARRNRAATREAYESLGMRACRVNGRTYWE